MVANTTFKSKREEIKIDGLKWINISDAGQEDIKYLENNFNFHHLDLEDCLTENQRSKIDEYSDYLFIILHLPFLHRRSKRITPIELDIFVKDGLLITVHENHSIINKIFDNCKKSPAVKKEYFNNSSGYLMYRILNEVFENVFPMVDDISKNLNSIELDVFEDYTGKDRLKDILLMKKDLINFRRIIMPQRSVIAQLEHLQMRFSQNELDVYFDNIVDKIEKIFGVLENLKDLVDSLHQTNESLISHNTNNIIRVLTLFSVIMLPLTVITGFYGMNLKKLPFDGNEFAVIIVGAIMLSVLVGMLSYFKYKKWL